MLTGKLLSFNAEICEVTQNIHLVYLDVESLRMLPPCRSVRQSFSKASLTNMRRRSDCSVSSILLQTCFCAPSCICTSQVCTNCADVHHFAHSHGSKVFLTENSLGLAPKVPTAFPYCCKHPRLLLFSPIHLHLA